MTNGPGNGWGGRRAQAARAAWADRVGSGSVVCHLCRQRIRPGQAWDLDHLIPLAVDPGRAWDPANVRPAHARCNRRRGAAMGNRMRRGKPVGPPVGDRAARCEWCGCAFLIPPKSAGRFCSAVCYARSMTKPTPAVYRVTWSCRVCGADCVRVGNSDRPPPREACGPEHAYVLTAIRAREAYRASVGTVTGNSVGNRVHPDPLPSRVSVETVSAAVVPVRACEHGRLRPVPEGVAFLAGRKGTDRKSVV